MGWAALGVIVPLVAALVAFAVQQMNRRTDRADDARNAEASTARADRAADSARRAVEAQEQMAAAMPEPSPWTLERHLGGTYVVTNTSPGTAYDVRLDLADLNRIMSYEREHGTVPPRGFFRFVTIRTTDVADDTVTVTWTASSGDANRLSWAQPIPGGAVG